MVELSNSHDRGWPTIGQEPCARQWLLHLSKPNFFRHMPT